MKEVLQKRFQMTPQPPETKMQAILIAKTHFMLLNEVSNHSLCVSVSMCLCLWFVYEKLKAFFLSSSKSLHTHALSPTPTYTFTHTHTHTHIHVYTYVPPSLPPPCNTGSKQVVEHQLGMGRCVTHGDESLRKNRRCDWRSTAFFFFLFR